ncbi:MAG: ribonuclease-III-like-domain-containing protein [Benniella sp.]|nr:MAG: ribonuclease-III-like-domain-containing protein [Benniella sp.]
MKALLFAAAPTDTDTILAPAARMLQRVSSFKPIRLANSVSQRIQYEARAYLSNTSTTQDSSAKVGAVYKRFGVDLSDSSLMTQSITHKSFSHGSVPTNERLGYLGRTFLEMHVTQRKWDKVNSKKILRSSVATSISADKLAKVARSMGVDEVMRWKSPSSSLGAKVGEDTILAHTMEAIVGAVYHDKGPKAAKEFITKHIYPY